MLKKGDFFSSVSDISSPVAGLAVQGNSAYAVVMNQSRTPGELQGFWQLPGDDRSSAAVVEPRALLEQLSRRISGKIRNLALAIPTGEIFEFKVQISGQLSPEQIKIALLAEAECRLPFSSDALLMDYCLVDRPAGHNPPRYLVAICRKSTIRVWQQAAASLNLQLVRCEPAKYCDNRADWYRKYSADSCGLGEKYRRLVQGTAYRLGQCLGDLPTTDGEPGTAVPESAAMARGTGTAQRPKIYPDHCHRSADGHRHPHSPRPSPDRKAANLAGTRVSIAATTPTARTGTAIAEQPAATRKNTQPATASHAGLAAPQPKSVRIIDLSAPLYSSRNQITASCD